MSKATKEEQVLNITKLAVLQHRATERLQLAAKETEIYTERLQTAISEFQSIYSDVELHQILNQIKDL